MKQLILLAATGALAFLGCQSDSGAGPSEQAKPSIEYASFVMDTVGLAASHPVTSSGGPVAQYSIEPALPAGLTLNATTGLISGTPSAASVETEYYVIAQGPGGRDTTVLNLEVLSPEANVVVALGLKGAPGYQIGRVLSRWTSSITADTVLSDTLLPGVNGLSASASANQTLSKTYRLKPLRSWKLVVVVFDTQDSLLYRDSAEVTNLRVAESRSLTLSLKPRFSKYAVKFILPDSLRPSGSGTRQILKVNRFRAALEGRVAVDTLKASGYFASGAPAHTIILPYVSNNSNHSFGLQILGDISGWPSTQPLFADTLVVAPIDTTYNRTLRWTGPGSPSDPNYNPASPASYPGITVTVGPLTVVTFEPVLPPGDPF